jgi:hypothetical protein
MADEKENNFLKKIFQPEAPAFEFDKVFDLDAQSIARTSTSFDLSLVWETTSDQRNSFEHHDCNETIDAIKKMYKEQIVKTTELQEKYDVLEQTSNETITALQYELSMHHITADAKVSDVYIKLGIAEQKYNQLLDDFGEADANFSKMEKTHQETLSDLLHKMVVLRNTTDIQLSDTNDALRNVEGICRDQLTKIKQLQHELDTYRIKPITPTWREDLEQHFTTLVENMSGNVRRPSDITLNEIKIQILHSIEEISKTEEPLFLYDTYMIMNDNAEHTTYTSKSNMWLITNQSIYELYKHYEGKHSTYNVQMMYYESPSRMPYGTFYGFVKHKTIQYEMIPALQKFCASHGLVGTTHPRDHYRTEGQYDSMMKKLRDTILALCD